MQATRVVCATNLSGVLGRAPIAVAVIVALVALGTACERDDPLADIRRRQSAGDLAGSVEPLRALLAERRDDPETLYLYGRALHATTTPTEALWALRGAMEAPEFLVPAGLTVAAGAYRTRNYTVALDALERVLAAHPDNLDALLLRAQTHAARKLDYEQALADAERVLAAQPDNVAAMEPKILALLGLDRIDEAATAMEVLGDAIRSTQLSQDGLAWHCATMAIFAQDGGHLELARERWAGCLEEFPSNREVVEKAIRFHDGQQEWDASIDVLRGALEDAPRSVAGRVALASRLRARGDAAEAEQQLLEATEFEEPDLRLGAWLGLVTHYQALGRYAVAADAAGRAVEVARTLGEVPPQILFDYADALVMAGEYEEAAEIAETIEVAAYRELILGRSLLHDGAPEAALDHFSEAFRTWPDNTFARYYAARAAEEIGDFDRAIEEYRYAIRLDPGATDARERLAALRSAEGKPILALHVLRTKANDTPLGVEGDLLSIRLFAWAGNREPLAVLIDRYRRRPAMFARAIASAAEGLELRAGPEVALRAIEGTQGLRLSDPIHVDALRAWVAIASRADRSADAVERVERAIAAHPRHAGLHALHGDALALAGASEDRIRAAYERGVALDSENVRALVGLGEHVPADDPQHALEWFERALSAAPADRDARLGAARALIRDGRPGDARARLEALLRDEPFDVEVARALADVGRAQGANERELERLSARITRFGGDSAASARASLTPDEAPGRGHSATDEG